MQPQGLPASGEGAARRSGRGAGDERGSLRSCLCDGAAGPGCGSGCSASSFKRMCGRPLRLPFRRLGIDGRSGMGNKLWTSGAGLRFQLLHVHGEQPAPQCG